MPLVYCSRRQELATARYVKYDQVRQIALLERSIFPALDSMRGPSLAPFAQQLDERYIKRGEESAQFGEGAVACLAKPLLARVLVPAPFPIKDKPREGAHTKEGANGGEH